MIGSKRARRRWLHRKPACFCWHCLPSKAKLRDKPRTTVERDALRRHDSAEGDRS